MALAIYGGDFRNQATLMLRGCAHILCLGDSQTYIGRSHTLFNRYLPASLPVRWNYVIWGVGGSPATNYGFSAAPTDASGTTTLRGDVVTHYDSGASTPVLGAPTWRTVYAGNSADTDWGGGGAWQLMRLASDTTTGKQMPWPLNVGAGNAPWYHGEYVKAAMVVQGQTAGSGVLSFDIGVARRGVSAPSNAETWTTVAVDDEATIQAVGFSSAIADVGNYATGTSAGTVNDHLVFVNGRTTTGYDETGKSLILMKAIVARCDSGGTITWNNTDGLDSGAGYDTIGRSGSAITDWETNYWTQTQWKEYFLSTVYVPNAVTVMPIMLGHNCVQVSGSVMTAAFTTSWLAFIAKIRAAYEEAFPVALIPTARLHIMIVMPWYSDRDSNFFQGQGVVGGRSMQAAYEAIAAQTTNCSWCSLFNYFGEAAPFDSLHADNEASGWMLGDAFMDMLHRATDFAYTPRGRVFSSALRRRGRG